MSNDAELLATLKSINVHLARLNGDIASLPDYQQKILMNSAIANASLGDVVQFIEDTPVLYEAYLRESKKAEDARYRLDNAMRIQAQDDTLDRLAAQVGNEKALSTAVGQKVKKPTGGLIW